MKTREQLETTGKKILDSVRTELYLSMRYLGPALGSLGFVMDLSTRTVGTDAVNIRFHPTYLLHTYLERPEILNRTYMHMLLHCLFRHMFSAKEHEDAVLWDLCCDIAVESVVDSMECSILSAPAELTPEQKEEQFLAGKEYSALARVTSDFRQEWYERLEKEVSVLTAEKLYQYFSLRKRDPYLEETLRQEFALCDHSFWQRMKEEPPEDQNKKQPPVEPQSPQTDSDQNQKTEEKPMDGTPLGKTDLKEEDWKETAKRIESDMETYAKDAAEDSGKLMWMLKINNRVRKSYKEFLKRFAVVREEVSIDMDSFDYGFYMYGLTHYGNMPLIEENEYREAKKVEELVIAIDTSASCKEKLVQQFLNETGAILKHQENFFHKVQIRIIECDDQIQKDIKITNLDEIDDYLEHFQVSGGYGTDFRPVFSYVEQLQNAGELKALKGLMYFTDGFGIYPKKPTGYQTVFVFYGEEEREEKQVPDWAVKLYLEEGETQ